ncbi:histidinol-phosphatase HisJ family protein [Salirhabdus salicampi]|uniref:histidinol-phosphatase HisJ family protein n=1 Tax=Salirhabdus salicampi TaxID=476102 RepID=UPI0020C3145C|nr:histidinol-phosphatase HisJ family protein [Salirhabdus salicampi]MCP8616109.1 histidinol-phosphatase HisJ family protein [Salirhabdus salicampi]
MKFDYHVHSEFSADCNIPMEKMVEAAIQKGIQKICFTEHIDIDYPDPTIDFDLNLTGYAQKVKDMQKQYGNDIDIYKGVELGVQPHVLPQYEEIVANNFFDFIICSMHTTDRKDLHSGNLFTDCSLHEAYEKYYSELLHCVKTYKEFNIVGHIDLVKRYKYEYNVHHFLDIMEEIFRVIIPEGKGIEINTSSFRYGLDQFMPSKDILQLYKEMNGEIITIGSDSHKPNTLNDRYDESVALLQDLGFKYVTTFQDQKPSFHKIT